MNLVGKAATWLLYASPRLRHGHARRHRTGRSGSSGPASRSAFVSLGEYVLQGPARGASREGRRDGRRRGDAAAAAHLEPAEADGADRRQAVHGAHPRAARARTGSTDVVVTVAFLPQAIRSYFGDGASLGLEHRVLGRGEPARHGRLGASRGGRARRHVPRHLGRRALRHRPRARSSSSTSEKGAACTIGLKSVENPLEFGIVVTDEDGRVERFLEKPSWGQVFSDTINTGIYVLEPEVLRHVPTDRPFDFSKELFPLLLEMGRPIYGCVCDGYWQDIGNLDQYRQANFDALDEKVRLNIAGSEAPRRRLDRRGRRDRRRRRRRGTGVHRQLLHDLARRVGRAVHGARRRASTLRERSRVSRSVIDASCYIGRSAVVEGAILGRNCDVRAARTRARGRRDRRPGDARRPVRDAIPGVRIYPYKEVEYGAQIHESLIWESRGTTRVFGKDGVVGLVNVDLTPEVALRFGAALGTALKRGARVVASRESAPAYRMIKRAIISGLNSTGVQVADLRTLPAPVGKHLLKTQGYDAAFHVGGASHDPEAVQIQLFERPGIALSAPLQKEIEKHFTRQELRRVSFVGRRRDLVSGPGARELRHRPALAPRRRCDPRARLPDRRRLRLLGRELRPPARARPARRRGGDRARVRIRLGVRPGAAAARRSHTRAGSSRAVERRPRRRLRPVGRADLPDRRARPGASGADQALLLFLRLLARERSPRQGRRPGHRDEPVEELAGDEPRDRPRRPRRCRS